MTTCIAVNNDIPVRKLDRDAHFSKLFSQMPGIALATADNKPVYEEACKFVGECFKRKFGANLASFMPYLMTMHNLGSVSNVVGLRPAVSQGIKQDLYLEQYLEEPVEKVLSQHLHKPALRSSMVEIGNQVASKQGASQIVFLLMSATLLQANFEWIVFTATHSLRNTLKKLDFPLLELGRASQSRLSLEEQNKWGTYYETEPYVMAGRLDAIEDIIARKPLLRQTLRVYESAIKDMSLILESQ